LVAKQGSLAPGHSRIAARRPLFQRDSGQFGSWRDGKTIFL